MNTVSMVDRSEELLRQMAGGKELLDVVIDDRTTALTIQTAVAAAATNAAQLGDEDTFTLLFLTGDVTVMATFLRSEAAHFKAGDFVGMNAARSLLDTAS